MLAAPKPFAPCFIPNHHSLAGADIHVRAIYPTFYDRTTRLNAMQTAGRYVRPSESLRQ